MALPPLENLYVNKDPCEYTCITLFRSIYEFTAKSLEGELVSLDKYKGKVLVVVNVASK